MPNTNAITKVNLAFEELKSRLMISSPNPISKLSGVLGINQSSNPSDIPINSRDTTKYLFNNRTYGKGRLVLAVVEQYASDYPETSNELLLIFPKKLQGSIGVFNELSYVKNKYGSKSHKRHFFKEHEVVQLSDCSIVVSTEWGSGNINQFIEQAEEHGYSITPTNG